MSVATPEIAARLQERLETAVRRCFEQFAGIRARAVSVDDQTRHIGKTLGCATTLFGEGWMGQLLILLPNDVGRDVATLVIRGASDRELHGAEIADGLGALCAAIGILFGREFSGEARITAGLPVVVQGGDLSVMFAWGHHFETRVSFTSGPGPFWVILRLSHTRQKSAD